MFPLVRSYLLLAILFLLIAPIDSCAQYSDTAIRNAAINHAVNQYKQFTKPPTALYNGPQYIDYVLTLQEGQPFFESPHYDSGAVLYDHLLYEGVPLKFDMVLNVLVTIDPSKHFDMSLFHDKISYFKIHGHTFIRIVKDSSQTLNTGFYDRLYHGKSITLLKKEERKVMTYVTERDGVRNVIESKQDFYTYANQAYHKTNNKNSLLNALYNKRDELSQFIRKNKLRFTKEQVDFTMIQIADYYQSLSK